MTPPPIASPRGGGASCPSCGAGVDTGAVLCVSCGHHLKTGKRVKTQKASDGGGGVGGGVALASAGGGGGGAGLLGYAAMAAPRRGGTGDEGKARGNDVFFSPVKDLYIPAALIVIGTILTYVEVWFNKGVKSPGLAIVVVGIVTIINLALVFPAVLTTVRLFDLGLGPLPTGLLKIAAAAIFPSSISAIIEATIGQGAGFFLAFMVSYVITVAVFMWLLEMDYFETVMCATIIWLIRTWLVYALLYMLVGSMIGGGGRGGGAAAGGGGGGGVGGTLGRGMAVAAGVSDGESATEDEKAPPAPPPPPPSWFRDQEAIGLLRDPAQDDAIDFVADGKNFFYGFPPDQSAEIVKQLRALGATNLVAVDIGVEHQSEVLSADALVCTLPSKSAVRLKIFEYCAKLREQKTDLDEIEDEGQRYLTIVFNEGGRPFPRGEYKPKPKKGAATRPATAPAIPIPVINPFGG